MSSIAVSALDEPRWRAYPMRECARSRGLALRGRATSRWVLGSRLTQSQTHPNTRSYSVIVWCHREMRTESRFSGGVLGSPAGSQNEFATGVVGKAMPPEALIYAGSRQSAPGMDQPGGDPCAGTRNLRPDAATTARKPASH